MLTMTVGGTEIFNEETNEFSISDGTTLQLEHSLLSLSKWEAKWKKPFLGTDKTTEESLDYIKHMTITRNIPDYIYDGLTIQEFQKIMEYINDSMTATTINNNDAKTSRKIITAEIIYYWMITFNIPIDFQKWHLSRLMTLIQVCSIENGPKKKMSRREAMAQNKSLNAARRAKLNSKG